MTTSTPKQAVPGRRPVSAGQPPAPPPRLRRRPWVVGAGLAAVGLGAAAGLVTGVALSDSREVLVAAGDLDKYHVIAAEDLRSVSVSLDSSVASIPSTDVASLIGKRLADGVPEGSLLSPADIADDAYPPEGSSVVRVTITAQQAQGLTLEPGDLVRVVVSAPSAATDTDPTFTPGEVAAVHAGDTGAVVDVLVARGEAVALSDAVMGGRASIVQDTGFAAGNDAGDTAADDGDGE